MAYHVIAPEEIDPLPDRPSRTHDVRVALDLEHLGLRIYVVEPGEDIPWSGLHYHDTQEEAFYVNEGSIHVETPNEEFQVATGELFVVEPENPHRAFNPAEADEPARVLGIGAPPVDDGHAVTEDHSETNGSSSR